MQTVTDKADLQYKYYINVHTNSTSLHRVFPYSLPVKMDHPLGIVFNHQYLKVKNNMRCSLGITVTSRLSRKADNPFADNRELAGLMYKIRTFLTSINSELLPIFHL